MSDVTIYGRVQTPQIDYTDGVPMAYWPSATMIFENGRWSRSEPRDKVSAVCRSLKECDDLIAWFGGHHDFCPDLPILLLIPGNHKLITGFGLSTVDELRDCCCETWCVYASSSAHKRFDGDEIRERLGLARREDVKEITREAFHERVKRHKASPITDPVKQWQYPNPTGRTLHKVADPNWKDN